MPSCARWLALLSSGRNPPTRSSVPIVECLSASRRRCTSVLLGCALFAARSVGGTVICVPNEAIDVSCTPAAGQPTIQQGIDAAIATDTVLVGPGSYAETVTAGHGGVVSGAPGIDIDKSLVLKSRDGAATTTISGDGG